MQASGHREVLGLSARLSEAEVHWRAFFEDLAGRGLKGMELVVSDDHAGLKAARRAVFPAVPWQRCQFHLSQNAQRFGRLQERGRSAKRCTSSTEDAEAMLKRKIKAFTEAGPVDGNVREGLTVYAFPRSLHKKIRTINGVENLNKQIRRRTRVVGIFPYRLGVATDLSRAGGDSRRVAHGPLLSEPGELARRGGILEERFPKPETLRSARVLGKGQPAIVALRASDRASFLGEGGGGAESLSASSASCSGLSF